MHQVNHHSFRINCDLSLIEDSLRDVSLSDIPEVARQISIVNDFIQGLLADPNLPFQERDFLLSKQDEVVHLSGRCNNLHRSKQLAFVLEAKVDSIRASRLTAFKQHYNLTTAERIKIKEGIDTKIIPITDKDTTVQDFSLLAEQGYQLAIYIHYADKGSFYNLFYSLPQEIRMQIQFHIAKCGGSLDQDSDSIDAIRALIGFAEQHHLGAIDYPSPEEAYKVIHDLISLNE
ncbi:MAG: hypothetical protein HY860_02600 [Chlamydiales bacterium]|nr:hypothetical protein [Chlamydiales bacterium]